jgi:hypothetical protein
MNTEISIDTGQTGWRHLHSARRRVWHSSAWRTTVAFYAVLTLGIRPAVEGQSAPSWRPQRGGAPKIDTPFIAVFPFFASDIALGALSSDLVREQIAADRTATELFVIMKRNIDKAWEPPASGSPTAHDSSVLVAAKAAHATVFVAGDVTNTGALVSIAPRLWFRTANEAIAEPLPRSEGRDVAAVSRDVARSILNALDVRPAYQNCSVNLRVGRTDVAAAAAVDGLRRFPQSVVLRVCLLDTYAADTGVPPRAVLSLANELRAIDSTTPPVLSRLANAYSQRGDSVNASWAVKRLELITGKKPR